jgi:aconitate decarboxylase
MTAPDNEPTRRIAEFIAAHDLAEIPPGCRALARRGILDALGCGLYGHTLPHIGWASPIGRDRGQEAHIWAEPDPVSAAGAALANGTAIHATEMSETFIRAVVHPGNVIVPAAVAVAEAQGATGAELLAAVALGYEVLIRYGFACGPPALLDQGLHTFSMLGVFGAATAAAKLQFGDDADAIGHTLGVAACLAPTTLLDGARQGSGIKDIYEGYGAWVGVRAAEFVALGATGPSNATDLWLHAVIRDPRPDHLTRDLGQRWLMDSGGLRIKLLPVMGLVQPTTVAVRDIQSRLVLSPREITDIRVHSTRRAVIAMETTPGTVTAAKASIPFTVAALIVRTDLAADDPYLLDFFRPEILHDPEVLRLAQLCTVVVDDAFEHNFESADQMRYESRVLIRLRGGQAVEGYADIWPATSRMTFDEVVPKFRACGGRALPSPALDRVVESVRHLEELASLGALTDALTQVPDRPEVT